MAFIEVISKRSQKAKHFYDPITDKWQAEFTIADRHYNDSGGNWQDVDENLVNDGADGFDKKCDKTRHIFRIASGGVRRWYPRRNIATEYVGISNIQYWRETGGGSWRNLNLPAAVWKNQGAEWDMANLYASITNTWKRIKSEFILKDGTAPTRLRFEIGLVGLTYNHATGELTSIAESAVVGWIDKPTAHDANEADVPVNAIYDGTYIEWSADTTGATFPVYVDPTFTDGYGGDVTTAKDSPVNSGAATYNYGAYLRFLQSNNDVLRGLIEFDLSSIDAGATCDSATLYNYQVLTNSAGATITIYSIASGNAAWIEGTQNAALAGSGEPCWNALAADGAGGVTTAWAGSAGLSTSGTDYEASSVGSYTVGTSDAAGTEYTAALTTTRVEGWFGSSNTNYGLILRNLSGFDVGRIATSDDTTTGRRPKLVVVYTAGGITAAENTQAQKSDAATLGVLYPVSPAEDNQAQVSDLVSLSLAITALTAAEDNQAQVSDTASLTFTGPTYNITGADNNQAQVSDAATLGVYTPIAQSQQNQAQVSDAVTFSSIVYPITVAENNQAQVSDTAIITSGEISITAADDNQAQVSDAVTISAIYPFIGAENNQAQVSDAASITFSGIGTVNITAAEDWQAQVSDPAILGVYYPISPDDNNQAQASDEAVITSSGPIYNITAADNWQAQAVDIPGLGVVYVIDPAQNYQAQISDLAVLSLTGVFEHGERRLYQFDARGTSVFATRADLEVDDG